LRDTRQGPRCGDQSSCHLGFGHIPPHSLP
jgi:hypothetical protein